MTKATDSKTTDTTPPAPSSAAPPIAEIAPEPPAAEPEDIEPTLDGPNAYNALTIDDKVRHLHARVTWQSRQLAKLTAPTPAKATS